ncbi:MAG: hypothetical protein FJ118_10025 [Deltaproteobacteria bacterium]|nr:hypothetical protein [Deltaproteobacteria bacterium]
MSANRTIETCLFEQMPSKALVRRVMMSELILVVSLWTGLCCAAEYHVNARHPSADDSNSGTIERPWRTLSKANATVQPGDTVSIHRGRYAESIAPVASGEPSQPIMYRAHKDDRVILDENPDSAACVNLGGRSHIVVKGFKVDRPGKNYPAYARMVGTQHCVIEDCEFAGSRLAYHGVLMEEDRNGRPCMYNTFRNVSLRGCAGDIVLLRGDAHHNLFVNCSLSDKGSDRSHANLMLHGMRPHGQSPRFNAFFQCVFSAVHHHAVNLAGGAHRNIFHGCILRNANKDANAMQMAGSDNIFRFCLVIDNRGRLKIDDNTFSLYTTRDQFFERGGFHTYSTATGNRIYNNTFTGNLGYAVTSFYWPADDDFPYRIGDNVFLNNIFAFNGRKRQGMEIYYNNARGKISGDLWANNLIGTKKGEEVIHLGSSIMSPTEAETAITFASFQRNIQGDPLFENPANGSYRLKAGSPCIDAGRPLTYAVADGSGTVLTVKDATFFCDGFGVMDGDLILVGRNQPVRVTAVLDGQRLQIDRSIVWKSSDPVTLPYKGAAPDIGALEYEE